MKKPLSISVDAECREWAQAQAKAEDRNPSYIINRLIKQAMAGKPVPKPPAVKAAPKGAYPDEFEFIWGERPKRQGGDPKQKAFKACQARVKEGAQWGDLARSMRAYRIYCEQTGKIGTEYVKQTATFFGPDGHWKETYEVNHEVNTGSNAKGLTAAERVAARYAAELEGGGVGVAKDERDLRGQVDSPAWGEGQSDVVDGDWETIPDRD